MCLKEWQVRMTETERSHLSITISPIIPKSRAVIDDEFDDDTGDWFYLHAVISFNLFWYHVSQCVMETEEDLEA